MIKYLCRINCKVLPRRSETLRDRILIAYEKYLAWERHFAQLTYRFRQSREAQLRADSLLYRMAAGTAINLINIDTQKKLKFKSSKSSTTNKTVSQ